MGDGKRHTITFSTGTKTGLRIRNIRVKTALLTKTSKATGAKCQFVSAIETGQKELHRFKKGPAPARYVVLPAYVLVALIVRFLKKGRKEDRHAVVLAV